MSGSFFLSPSTGTRIKTMAEQELEAAVAAERERCAAIADAEAAEAYRNPRASSYRNPEMEKMDSYTAKRIASLIRRGDKATTHG